MPGENHVSKGQSFLCGSPAATERENVSAWTSPRTHARVAYNWPVLTSAPAAAAQTETPAATSARLLSLDVFRGGTVAAMILVNNPGSGKAVYAPFEHAAWHGWTFTDLVFPFFLWIAGVSITFSFAKRVARGDDRGRLLLHIAKRSFLIWLLGFILTGLPTFHLSTIRIPGVLARIAVCYLIAGTIFLFTGTRGRLAWTAGLLAVYWILMKFVPVPGYGAGILEVPGNFAWYVDGLFLQGHMYSATKTWDPEGIVSTLPAIATTLFGIFAGQILQSARGAAEKASWLFLTGNVLLFAGLMLSTWMPINKKLWTTSFSVFMAGMAFCVFACCYWLIDVQGWRRFAKPFEIFGLNAIALYFFSGLLGKLAYLIHLTPNLTLQGWLFGTLFAPVGPPALASLLYAAAMVLTCFGIAYVMYRQRWFVRF